MAIVTVSELSEQYRKGKLTNEEFYARLTSLRGQLDEAKLDELMLSLRHEIDRLKKDLAEYSRKQNALKPPRKAVG